MKHFSFLRHGLVLVTLSALGHFSVHAQGVGVGTTAPDASAALDIVSSTKGALLPRLALASTITNPATGLIVYQTGGTPGYYYNAGTSAAPSWQQLATVAGTAVTTSNGLTKTGNNFTLGGTLSQATTVANAGFALNVTGTGTTSFGASVGIGTTTPLVPLSVMPGGLGPKITLWDAGSTTQHYGFGISGNQLNYQVQGTADHVFSKGGKNNDGTEMMRLLGTTGSLGIGTATPSALLDVNGSTRLRGLTTAGLVQTDASGNLTSATAASLDPTTASNGLTKTGNNFALGGTLTGATAVAQAGKPFGFTGGNVGIGNSAPAGLLDVSVPLSIAAAAVDQQQLTYDGIAGPFSYYQSFTAGASGQLQQITLYEAVTNNSNGGAAAPAMLKLYQGTGTGGTLLASQAYSSPNGSSGGTIVTFATPAMCVAGQVYTFAVSLVSGASATGTYYALPICMSNCYAGGGCNLSPASYDVKFQTKVAAVTATVTGLLVSNNGNVGMGTATPSQKLEVAGQIFSNTGGFRFPDNTVQTSATTTGPAGATGPAGPQGYAGLDGATGMTGSQGSSGAAGMNGMNGMDGVNGATGATGATGNTGYPGPAGAPGAAGVAGPAGAPGPTGPTGPAGPAGTTGATGPAGSNATVTAANGLTATSASGVTSVKLGGALTGATAITQAGNAFSLTGGNVGIGTASPAGSFEVVAPGTYGSATVDQQQLVTNGGTTANPACYQTFTAGMSGQLQTLVIYGSSSVATATANIYQGSSTGGTLLASQAFTASASGMPQTSVTFTTPATVTTGQMYTFQISVPGTAFSGGGCNTNCYPNGGNSCGSGSFDVAFQTLVAVLSAPQSALLVNAGKVGIGITSPSALLDVNGSTRLRGLTTAGLVQTDANGNLTSATAASLDPTTASNGLTKTSNNFALGGTLTAATTVAQAGNAFSLTGGNVGIGTATPASKLTVQTASDADQGLRVTDGTTTGNIVIQPLAGSNTGFSVINYNGYYGASGEARYNTTKNRWRVGVDQRASTDMFFIDSYNGTTGVTPLAITAAGNVGIGTTNPIAKLHVNGSVTATDVAQNISYFSQGSGFNSGVAQGAGTTRALSGYFEGGQFWVNATIVAGAMNVSSDRRIKHVVGLSNRAADLDMLNKIRVTDYTYIDKLANTDKLVKKVIAQEIQALMPVAVNTSYQAIPNVYEKATRVSFANGRVTVTTAKAHELPAAGGKMRLYTTANVDLNADATVVDAHTFSFASDQAYDGGLFVYGKFVDDFLSVDYDAIAMLNVSATQELARKVDALEKQNVALQARATQADADHASLLTMQAQLARLLGEAAPAGAQARR